MGHGHKKSELRKWWKQFKAAGWNVQELARRTRTSATTWQHRVESCEAVLGLKRGKSVKAIDGRLSESALRETFAIYAKHNGNQIQAARELKIGRTTLQARLADAAARLDLKYDGAAPKLDGRDLQRYRDRIAGLQDELRKANRALNETEDLRSHLFDLTQQDLSPPDFKIGITVRGNDVPAIPFLLVSDEQAGEVIRAGEIEGINEYNSDIYRERHRKVFSVAAEISKRHMRVVEPGIVVGWLGDAISGSIHAELRETNDVKDVPAVKMVVEEREAAIRALLSQYRRVFAVVTAGNHGRLTVKPSFKSYMNTNLETVIGWWLQSIFRNEPRVRIVVPPSGDYYMPLWGWNTLFTHGDRIGTGGGMGFGGPAFPIIRGSKKVYEQQAKIGRNLHFLNFGHWHTRLETPYGFANGCLCGFGEFAYGLRFAPASAEQWLYYLNPEKGATARWPIYLTDQPKGFSSEDAIEWFKGAKAA